MYRFVASILLVIPWLTASITSNNVDPKDIVLIEGRRYYFGSTLEVTVPEALSVCQEINMTLSGLETLEEFTAVTNYMQTNLNLGLLWWTSGCRQSTSWIWSNTGQSFTYFKWDTAYGDPTITDVRTQGCLYVYDVTGLMRDNWCEINHNFICEERSC
ncbi:hypothetical protein B566_EDAN013906 [Ephemera danica]|nr:hypothetical protein B566_EDAN013906 [Ephemera danica]